VRKWAIRRSFAGRVQFIPFVRPDEGQTVLLFYSDKAKAELAGITRKHVRSSTNSPQTFYPVPGQVIRGPAMMAGIKELASSVPKPATETWLRQNEGGAALLQRRLASVQRDDGYLPSSALRVNSSFCCALALSHFCM